MRFSFGGDTSAEKALRQAERYVQQGKFAAAVDEYRKILDSSPRDITLLNTVGDLCVRAGRSDDAARYFRLAADEYESNGATQSAIAVYKKLHKLGAGGPDLTVKLAELLCRQGLIHDARLQYASAVEAYRCAGDAQRALRVQQKIADIDPENVECRLELAEQYRASGYPREAYQAYVQAGVELQRKRRFAEAAPVFAKALEVRPDSKVALGALVDCLVHRGSVDEAERMLDGMIAAAPSDPDLVAALAKVQLSAGRLAEAERSFARLAEVDPARPDATLEVARHHVAAGAFDRAIRIVDEALDRLLAHGQKKKATAVLKEILLRDPTNVDVLERLAAIYQRVGERRNLAATLNTLVEAATRRGLKDRAKAALQRLMDVDPEAAVERPFAPPPEPRERQPLAPAQAFPEGFESAPALAEWMRGGTSAPGPGRDEPPRLEPARVAPEEDLSFPASSEYSMELADELVASHPEFRAARIKLLEDLVASQPKYAVGRVKLKDLYVEAGMRERAATECVELARLFEEQGDRARAKAFVLEAYELRPSIDALATTAGPGATAAPGPAAPQPAAPQAEEVVHLEDMFTRREFDKYFEREWRRAMRDGKPLSLLKVEVDAVNDYFDTYGLLGGEYTLERVASALEAELLRPGDLISNCGGGLFLALLPDTPLESAPVVAERLRSRVEGLGIRHESSPLAAVVTVSVGIATAIPHASYSSDALLAAADDALVKARIEGANRSVASPLVTA